MTLVLFLLILNVSVMQMKITYTNTSQLEYPPTHTPSYQEPCSFHGACEKQEDNRLDFFTNVKSSEECRILCEENYLCDYYTWYGTSGAFPNKCFIFEKCVKFDLGCIDCYSGKWLCDTNIHNCSPVESNHGGTFYCMPDVPLGDLVTSGTDCIFRCGENTEPTFCRGNRWSKHPSTFNCSCDLPPEIDEGQYVCFPPLNYEDDQVEGNTQCMFSCDGYTKAELTCRDSQWIIEPNVTLSCHAGQPLHVTVLTTNAINNEVLPNVSVQYSVGSIVNGSETTDNNGMLILTIESDLLPTSIHFNASIDGFYNELLTIQVGVNAADMIVSLSLTPELPEEQELRIVMNWGTYPSDLDLHAYQIDQVGEVCETYFMNKDGCPGLYLDVDNRDGGDYGAETITLEEPGSYTYLMFVFDYSGDVDHYLVDSGARIALYNGGNHSDQTIRMNVPTTDTNSHSRYWVVGCISGSEGIDSFTAINKLLESKPNINSCG